MVAYAAIPAPMYASAMDTVTDIMTGIAFFFTEIPDSKLVNPRGWLCNSNLSKGALELERCEAMNSSNCKFKRQGAVKPALVLGKIVTEFSQ
mmetsp:Transcript_98511/g.211159  ORF Transcript_98511/g.211159 Transcript_98511/m.211159 type:complete len:92 (-) Transcript_98511:1887-2162(-)